MTSSPANVERGNPRERPQNNCDHGNRGQFDQHQHSHQHPNNTRSTKLEHDQRLGRSVPAGMQRERMRDGGDSLVEPRVVILGRIRGRTPLHLKLLVDIASAAHHDVALWVATSVGEPRVLVPACACAERLGHRDCRSVAESGRHRSTQCCGVVGGWVDAPARAYVCACVCACVYVHPRGRHRQRLRTQKSWVFFSRPRPLTQTHVEYRAGQLQTRGLTHPHQLPRRCCCSVGRTIPRPAAQSAQRPQQCRGTNSSWSLHRS